MSIQICPECKKEVSSNASVCPHCGNIINNDGKLVTLQKTKKKWKILRLIAWFLLIVGVFSLINGGSAGEAFISISIIIWIISKVGAYWSNG
jgi:predicted nucleic acid-binding Zn ribbon protein